MVNYKRTMEATLILRVLSAAVCILSVIYWMLRRPKNEEPPPLSGYLPLLGHIHLVIGDNKRIIKVIKRSAEECLRTENALSFWMGPKRIYVVTDPDDCLRIANTCFETPYTFANEVFGNGLLTCPVSVWKRHRKLINPAFSQQVLDDFMPIFNQQSRHLVETFRTQVGKGYFDNLHHLRRNTLQTICLTAMGIDITEQTKTNLHYLESFDRLLGVIIERAMKPWMYINFIFAFTKLKKTQETYLKAFNDMSATVLEKKKRQLNLEPNGISKAKKKSFIDLLLEDGVLTDAEIKEEVDTFMAAGHETVATLLVLILVLLGSFDEVQERVVLEFKQMFEDRDKGEDLKRQDLSRLHYLEAVIKESMRYYSFVPFVMRELDRDIRLKNYTLRSGKLCMLFLYALHRNPMWGPDADEFRPERWLDQTTIPRHPAAFAGFSIGKRNCIGQTYAMMSIKTVIVHLLRHYRVKSDHRKVQMKVDFIFRPKTGYDIALEPREQ